MSQVIDTCKQLAEEIQCCPEYVRMEIAQNKVQANEEALEIILDYREKYNALTDAFGTQEEDPDGFKEKAFALREAEDAMQGNALVKEMMDAQRDFSMLLDEINGILDQAVSGSSGCSGNCATCGGCAR